MFDFRYKEDMRIEPKRKIVKRNPLGYVLESIEKVGEWLWMVEIQTPEGVPIRFSQFMREGTDEKVKEWARQWCHRSNAEIGIEPNRGKEKYKAAMSIRLRGTKHWDDDE